MQLGVLSILTEVLRRSVWIADLTVREHSIGSLRNDTKWHQENIEKVGLNR